MNKQEAYEYVIENFHIDHFGRELLSNILDHAEGMASDEQYQFLTKMLDCQLTDNEIKKISY